MHPSLIDPALRRPDLRGGAPGDGAELHDAEQHGADLGGHDLLAVRAWARSRGYPIDESAGVPLVVLKTYRRLHAR